MLNKRIADNKEALYIVNFFKAKSDYNRIDAVCAMNLIDKLHNDIIDVNNIVHKGYIMCRYMHPDIEDVIAILIFKDIKNGILRKTDCINTFSSPRGVEYYKYSSFGALEVKGTLRDVPLSDDGTPKYTQDECYEIHIMHRVCDKMYDNIGYKLKRFYNAFNVLDAYTMAREAHYWVKRATGEPYITHPLMVAEILADFGVESPVIAAALLHDVAEDTDISIADIKERCGGQVSRYVNAVTSLHREYERLTAPEDRSKTKEELDKESFEKLVSLVDSSRPMVFALYIKAADRIHNLRTMDTMSQLKKRNKSDETESLYLPLFKRYNLHYFCDIIEDLLWKLGNAELYNDISERYWDMRIRNKEQATGTIKLVKELFDDDFNVQCDKRANIPGFEYSVSEHYYSPLEISRYLKRKYCSDIDITKHISKRNLPICDVDIVLDPKDRRCDIKSFANVFMAVCANQLAENGRVITDFDIDENNRFIVFVEDDYYNIVRCCFCMRADYMNYLNGGNGGFNAKEMKVYSANSVPGMITVRLRNGKKVHIDEGATVLDLAFRIHQEIALSAIDATINNQPATIFSQLHDEDQVVVVSDSYRDKDGLTREIKIHAKLEWLKYVKTDFAKEKLIEYFQGEYENDNVPIYRES